jgi:hypothetical protein
MVIRNKKNKNNQIDIIELQNVVKFENWIYRIENKQFKFEILISITKMSELEILKSKLLNIKLLKN